jgi:hypothetical protein
VYEIVFAILRAAGISEESGGAPPHSKALHAKEIFSCVPAFLIENQTHVPSQIALKPSFLSSRCCDFRGG